jgi:hypothetical protein
MNTLINKSTTTDCAGCPAKGPLAGQDARVVAQARVPGQRVTATTYTTGGVILTTVNHGTFLIRRRQSSAASRCPLLDYEVCRIDAEEFSGRTSGGPAEMATRAACQKLLKLAIVQQI